MNNRERFFNLLENKDIGSEAVIGFHGYHPLGKEGMIVHVMLDKKICIIGVEISGLPAIILLWIIQLVIPILAALEYIVVSDDLYAKAPDLL